MSFDFTLNKYQELCQSAEKSTYTVLTVENYLTSKKLPAKILIFRHDVDRKPHNALEMAKVEQRHGIKSTYYFRINNTVFIPDLIKEIAAMGHEIGYHYESLDKAKGDYPGAIRIFEEDLAALRNVADVKTICMHGNPLTKWDNRDLWKKYDFTQFGILGEAYLSFNTPITYLSDTGRTWDNRYKVKDRLPSAIRSDNDQDAVVKTTADVIRLVKKESCDFLYLLAHPERWNNSLGGWTTYLAMDTGVNLGKWILSLRRGKQS